MVTLIRIDRWDPRRDGALTEAALRRKLESLGYQVSMCAWEAGAIVAAQSQPRERVDAVIAGVLKITVDGESAILTAGDIAYVPRGAVRRLEVMGTVPAACLTAVHAR
jgi:quercetin dioxygenase-like cupin family protein